MKLTVTINLPEDAQFLHQDFDPLLTLGDLKALLLESSLPDGFPSHTWLLRHNQHVLGSDKDGQSLEQVGIKNDDMLEATPQVASQPRQPRQSQQQANYAPPNSLDITRLEELRQHMITDPQARDDLARLHPEASAVVDDPTRFREVWWHILQTSRQAATREDRRLNEDVNEENQAKIMDRIRRERIDKDFEEVTEQHPELLGRVTMLYIGIEVNGHPVKAFVDSGAQATIISPSCADACGLTHLIDERWQSIARGVGTAKILGRIHKAPLKIGYDELACSFTVLEGKDVDMLFGLDMLKRYQASINLVKNCLEFPNGVCVPFLPEGELPRSFEDEPTVETPAGAKIGTQSGAVKSPGPTASATASSSQQRPAPGQAFRGQGQTLGSAPSAPSPAQQPAPAPAAAPAAAPARPPADAAFSEQDIQAVMNVGATREQAVAALQSCAGNVEMAAAFVFEYM